MWVYYVSGKLYTQPSTRILFPWRQFYKGLISLLNVRIKVSNDYIHSSGSWSFSCIYISETYITLFLEKQQQQQLWSLRNSVLLPTIKTYLWVLSCLTVFKKCLSAIAAVFMMSPAFCWEWAGNDEGENSRKGLKTLCGTPWSRLCVVWPCRQSLLAPGMRSLVFM